MSDATIERIGHRYNQLQKQDDRYFVLHLETYIAALDDERRVRRSLKALRDEADEALEAFADTDRDLVKELVSIRKRLARSAPEIDGSGSPEPSAPLEHRTWLMETLAGFDSLVQQETEIGFASYPESAPANPGRTQALVQNLRGRLYQAQWGHAYGRGAQPQHKRRNDLDSFEIEIENVQARYTAARNRFKQHELTLPGLAEERIRLFAKSLNPEPFLRDPDENDGDFMERSFIHVLNEMGYRGILRRGTSGETLNKAEARIFHDVVNFLRGEVDRMHAEVVDRLRMDQRSFRVRAPRWLGSTSKKAVALYAAAIIGLVATATVAYMKDWVWGPDDDPQAPTNPTDTTSRPRE
jgi:hypothetical protein